MVLPGLLVALGIFVAFITPPSHPDPFAPCRELRTGYKPVLVRGVWTCEQQPEDN